MSDGTIHLLVLNAGIPMFGIWPFMGIALAPVVLIEWLVVRRRPALAQAPVAMGLVWANLVSTLVGVPLAWLFAFALSDGRMHQLDTPAERVQAVILQAAWLPPYANEHLRWMVPAAFVVLLMPCFLLSVLFEHWVCRRFWRPAPPDEILAAVVRMNLASYAFLVLVVVGLALVSNLR
jgi:hypothetical protein